MKVLVAPDKFKGSLTAVEAALAIREGLISVWPNAEYVLRPIADGGEGTAEALQQALQGEWVEMKVKDPLGRPVLARFCWIDRPQGSLAVLEMSDASGLRRLTDQERNPLHATTRGTGELILAAAQRGAQQIIVGIGGSATNDGGAGMAAALGYRFIADSGEAIDPIPIHLCRLAHIEPPPNLCLPSIVAAVDVQNPLLGPTGATRTYGPQKGAGPAELDVLERALTRLADVVRDDLGQEVRNVPGTGAAGGLGFGLLAFCNAQMRPGFDLIAEALQLEDAIAEADLIVTGEGQMDSQTLHGKGPAGVAELAIKHSKPVIAFAGSVTHEEQLNRLFLAISPLTNRPMALSEAMTNAKALLGASATRTARLLALKLPAE